MAYDTFPQLTLFSKRIVQMTTLIRTSSRLLHSHIRHPRTETSSQVDGAPKLLVNPSAIHFDIQANQLGTRPDGSLVGRTDSLGAPASERSVPRHFSWAPHTKSMLQERRRHIFPWAASSIL